MRILLDTHMLIWMFSDDPLLSPAARDLILDYGNQLYCSAAAPWEIAIKRSKRPEAIIDTARFLKYCEKAQVSVLPITADHISGLDKLPAVHSDPFDRIMLAQCLVEGMHFLTHDSRIREYDLPFILPA